ncbi:GTP cyclohydrolase II [Pyxidicoccus fallax]|uniref:GTP cyclohydrolase II n=1 Tax=Pyxidicoccus fallax TaxID=394095 RepID=A0A848LDS5_9BACT|nr:GTP cyclohydrolase II [Pyxidicoccus fallax]NMO17240.1 GTP cyclohydrolase II [Pyxidicoccus fallax]NPC81052.1 GTP cyclohydrolase II [Pyxidicoccus fallax]
MPSQPASWPHSNPRQHATHGLLLRLGEQRLETRHGDFQVHVFQNLSTRTYALAVCRGDLQAPEPLLARVHSACITSEAFGGCDCDCAEQLDLALERIAGAGRGIVFYLMQEGRGAGYAAKARDRMLVQASRQRLTTFEAYQSLGLESDHRRYHEVGLALRLLGVSAPLRLLTNNPEKTRALQEQGLVVEAAERVQREASAFNVHYLSSKRRVGHALASGLLKQKEAELPERVSSFEPAPLETAPYLLRMASYLLPIRVGPESALAWFRAHVYFDLLAGRERVVLTYGQSGEGLRRVPLVRIQRESLLERFPLRHGLYKPQWKRTVAEMVRHGHGVVVFPSADGDEAMLVASTLGPQVRPEQRAASRFTDEALFVLLAHHVPGRAVTPAFTSLDEDGARRVMNDALARHGFSLTSPSVFKIAS